MVPFSFCFLWKETGVMLLQGEIMSILHVHNQLLTLMITCHFLQQLRTEKQYFSHHMMFLNLTLVHILVRWVWNIWLLFVFWAVPKWSCRDGQIGFKVAVGLWTRLGMQIQAKPMKVVAPLFLDQVLCSPCVMHMSLLDLTRNW